MDFQWFDVWRALNVALCVVALSMMLWNFFRDREDWNTKTRDYWFSLLLWIVLGIDAAVEAFFADDGVTGRLILTSLAIGVTLKGLLNPAAWGGPK